MWWAGSEAHDIYLGTRAVAVCRRSEVLLLQSVEGFEAALKELSAWRDKAPVRPKVRIWLSGGLCRPFLLPPVAGVGRAGEKQRMGEALAAQYTGLPGPCRVEIDAANSGATRAAVAMEKSRLDQLLELFGKHAPASIRPWWDDVLRSATQQAAPPRVVAVQDCDSLTVVVGETDKSNALTLAKTLSPVVDREAANAALARLLMSADVGDDEVTVGRLMLQRPSTSSGGEYLGALAPLVEWSR